MLTVEVGNEITVTIRETQLNIHNSRILVGRIKELFSEHERDVVINLENVMFLDSSTIASFIEVYNMVKEARKELSFTNPSPFVRKIFEMLHLSKFFKIQ